LNQLSKRFFIIMPVFYRLQIILCQYQIFGNKVMLNTLMQIWDFPVGTGIKNFSKFLSG
jgi:hypothetical protein